MKRDRRLGGRSGGRRDRRVRGYDAGGRIGVVSGFARPRPRPGIPGTGCPRDPRPLFLPFVAPLLLFIVREVDVQSGPPAARDGVPRHVPEIDVRLGVPRAHGAAKQSRGGGVRVHRERSRRAVTPEHVRGVTRRALRPGLGQRGERRQRAPRIRRETRRIPAPKSSAPSSAAMSVDPSGFAESSDASFSLIPSPSPISPVSPVSPVPSRTSTARSCVSAHPSRSSRNVQNNRAASAQSRVVPAPSRSPRARVRRAPPAPPRSPF